MFTVAQIAGWLFFAATMVAAAVQDVRHLRIGNLLVLGLGLGWIGHAILGLPLDAALDALMVGAMTLLGGFLIFCRGWIGAGDAKLAAAIALWLGPVATVAFLLYSAIAGALICALLAGIRAAKVESALPSRRWSLQLARPASPVPYGIALATGALIAAARHFGLPS